MPSKSPPRLVQCAPAVRNRKGFAGDLRGISGGFAVILGDLRLWAEKGGPVSGGAFRIHPLRK